MQTRTETNKEIRDLLKKITGTTWSVKGHTGTAYGWINISAPPKRHPAGCSTLDSIDQWQLTLALGRDRLVSHQGESISPDSRDHFMQTLRERAAAGTTVSRKDAEKRYAAERTGAIEDAERQMCDLVRKRGADVADWQIDQVAQGISYRHGLRSTEADALARDALALVLSEVAAEATPAPVVTHPDFSLATA